jgi:hypothetical protein
VVAFAFEDSSRAELFYSTIRKTERRYEYTQATTASEDFIQRNESITKTFGLIGKATRVVLFAVAFHMSSSDQ